MAINWDKIREDFPITRKYVNLNNASGNAIPRQVFEERIFYLTDYLVDKLQSLDLSISTPLEKQCRSGIIVFRTNKADEIVKKLAEKKILVSPRGEGIRISPHFYNNEDDIDSLVKNLKPVV